MESELFADREDAGRKLSEEVLEFKDDNAIVFAVPRGGVPVGFEVAKCLDADFDVIVPRKIPIPWNTEAGFGAITEDGTMVLNTPMVRSLGLSEEEIKHEAEAVRREVARRLEKYRGGAAPPNPKGRPVILVDDGLASGYTMLAAIESLRKHSPAAVVVAVPVASGGAARLVRPRTDRLVALIVSERLPFAVADFYRRWRDLTDDDVAHYLRRAVDLGLRERITARPNASP